MSEQMTEWSARVDLAGAVTDEQAEDLAEALAGHGAAVGTTSGRGTVQLSVDTETLEAAVAAALAVVAAALPAGVQMVGVEVVTAVELGRRLAVPAPVELVDTEQAGEILGVSRQRVEKMARDLAEFPSPAANVGRGRRRVWSRQVIEEYARVREAAHPGRRPYSNTDPAAAAVGR